MKHSKSLLLILLMTLSSILCAAVPETTKALRVISQNQNEIRMKLSIPTLDIKPAELATTDFQELNLEGFAQTAETGKAQLPFISTTLAIPANGNFHVQVIERAQKSIAGIVLKPVFATDSAREAVEYDHAFYQSEGFYPRQIMEHTNPVIIRDFRVVTISIYPVRWNPATQELCYTEDLDLVISFDGSPSENEMAAYSGYSKTFEKVYEGLIDNFDYYRTTDDTPQTPKVLLIYGNSTDQTYLSKVTELADWKRQKGFDVFSVSTSTTGSSNTAIKNYIQARYDNLDTRPDFIILLGDVGGSYPIPAWTENVSGYNGEGDYPYTFLAGSDLLGDAYIGRISASNLSELQILLKKIYTYEQN
ncbi:MAG: C25 family peptidase propeptide domain-containing protein, partial [Candidatus Cloacimonetes bacterium]|nr:C25 family peptidase propeptide domain-containing protein [Candidatus Cloacimonadota bacterium]